MCNAVTAALTTAERARALGVEVELEPIEDAERRIYEACGMPVGSVPDITG